MIDLIREPWAWYVSGPILALVMIALLIVGGEFGVSSTLKTLCTLSGAGKKSSFFNFNWRSQIWNIVFIGGTVIGGYIAANFMSSPSISIAPETTQDLQALGISSNDSMLPTEIIHWERLFSLRGFLVMIVGGFLIGFGSRYAGGCTSGHAISGLSNLQFPSLIAVIGFFIGGLITTFFLLPLILSLS